MRNTGPVEMICEELQRHRDGFDRAEYGVTGRFGGFTCQSEKTGLTCRNQDGHGFSRPAPARRGSDPATGQHTRAPVASAIWRRARKSR